jgi:hypothetical protein
MRKLWDNCQQHLAVAELARGLDAMTFAATHFALLYLGVNGWPVAAAPDEIADRIQLTPSYVIEL